MRSTIKIVILCLLIQLCCSSCTPVFDELNYLLDKAIQEFQEKILKDSNLVLKDIKSLNEARYLAFMAANYGLSSGEISALTPADISDILRLGSFITDVLSKDTWSDIWKRVESLFDRFQVLKDFSFVKENPFYRNNSKVRRFIDVNIEREVERQKNIENLLELCATYREIEDERLDLIRKWEQYLKEYASIDDPQTGAASTSKLLALFSFVKIESLKTDMQFNILLRIRVENDVKENVYDIDLFKRYMKNRNENYKSDRRGQ